MEHVEPWPRSIRTEWARVPVMAHTRSQVDLDADPVPPDRTDPLSMQIRQPVTGLGVWPSGYLVGWGAHPRPHEVLCTSPVASPTIVLADGGEGPAPRVPCGSPFLNTER